MQIDRGCGGGSMAQEQLDMVKARSCLDQVSGKGVPEGVRARRFPYAGTFLCLQEDVSYGRVAERGVRFLSLKQPLCGTIRSPVLSQALKGGFRQDAVTVLFAFALLHPDHHTLAVDVGHPQAGRLADPESC